MSTDTTNATAGSAARDARVQPVSPVERLRQDAAEAAEVRRWSQHPDVIALRVERVRTQIDVLVWAGIVLGLGFTMVNVQTFAARHAPAWSLPWLAAWLLDPMVSLVLIAVLRAEQVTARWQVGTGTWANRTKWFAFAATYVMNTWASWAVLSAAGVVLHSVPPVLVFLASETAPALRDRLTEAVTRAAAPPAEHGEHADAAPGALGIPAGPVAGGSTSAAEQVTQPLPVLPAVSAEPAPAGKPSTPRRPARRQPSKAGSTGKRLSREQYRALARAALTTETDVTPAWVREVAGCSKGLSSALAPLLRADQAALSPTPAGTGSTAAESTEAAVTESAESAEREAA